MIVYDLCSGLGGATQAFKDRGYTVITIDINPAFNPDIVADIRTLTVEDLPYPYADFVWASPPCIIFSRESMPWIKTGKVPDMSIVLACKRLIDELNPPFWVIENVRGAVKWFRPYLGDPILRVGPFYLWGKLPPLIPQVVLPRKIKQRYSGKNPELRAKIPYSLSLAICKAIEMYLGEL